MATTKNINQLPLDMLTKIFIQYIEKPLPQQPIKILMQLRCVCKLWDHLIRSKSFIQDHLDHQKTSSNSNKYLLIDCGSSFIAHLIDSENSYNVLRSNVYNIHDVFDNACFLETYGVCDGVICLSCFSLFCIYLWNPIVRTVKKLPYGTGFPSHCQPAYTLCFGFHDNDYKVIKVVHSVDMYHIGIYSLNADSWKFSEFKTSNYFAQDKHHYDCTAKMRPYPRARLVNEAVYFIRYTSTSGRIVVFFDLSSEMIREINLPEDFQYSNAYGMEEYRDSLALVGYKKRYDNDVVMWVLKVSDNSFCGRKNPLSKQETITWRV